MTAMPQLVSLFNAVGGGAAALIAITDYGHDTHMSSGTATATVLDVLIGDATLFPRSEEVEASWRVIDPLEAFWAGQSPHLYRAGEWGPKEADEMLARDGRNWRRP